MADVINGNEFGGEWGEHVNAWSSCSDADMQIIKFEELISNTQNAIKLLSEYLDIEVAGSSIPSFEDLQTVNPKFFKSGKKDSWKKEFSYEDNVLFWLKNYKQMMLYGYIDDMPGMFNDEEAVYLFRALSDENKYLQRKVKELRVDITKVVNDLALNFDSLKKALTGEHNRSDDLKLALDDKNKQLEAIYNSRRWKYSSYVMKMFGRD